MAVAFGFAQLARLCACRVAIDEEARTHPNHKRLHLGYNRSALERSTRCELRAAHCGYEGVNGGHQPPKLGPVGRWHAHGTHGVPFQCGATALPTPQENLLPVVVVVCVWGGGQSIPGKWVGWW